MNRNARSRASLAALLLLGLLGLAASGHVAGCSNETPPDPDAESRDEPIGDTTAPGLNLPPPGAGAPLGSPDEKRPPPAFRFEDWSEESGIAAVNHSGRAGVKEYLPEAVGVGPAWF